MIYEQVTNNFKPHYTG